jgi:hypothetical protein
LTRLRAGVKVLSGSLKLAVGTPCTKTRVRGRKSRAGTVDRLLVRTLLALLHVETSLLRCKAAYGASRLARTRLVAKT